MVEIAALEQNKKNEKKLQQFKRPLGQYPDSENSKMLMKKSKMIQADGKIYCVLGLEELILSKWLYYPKQSTNSMQFLSDYQWHFFTEHILKICMETRKTLNSQSNLKKEKQLGESGSQTIDYTTKLQESKQCRTGTKTDINGTG